MIGLFGNHRSSGASEPGLRAIGSAKHSDASTANNYNNYSSSGGGSGSGASKTYFEKGFSKFERSGQDVMARASQIVQ